MMKLPIYEQIANDIMNCTSCGLGEGLIDGQNPHVVGGGNLSAKIMFIAEAPGEKETIHRRPLTPPGKSGIIYEKVLAGIGLTRDDVYTTNVVACRPPGNRDPDVHEVHRCKPFFQRQLELIQPELIVTFGRFAASALLGNIKITKDRGQIHRSSTFNVDVFPMYHPAYVGAYANAEKRLEFKRDVKYLKNLVKGYL